MQNWNTERWCEGAAGFLTAVKRWTQRSTRLCLTQFSNTLNQWDPDTLWRLRYPQFILNFSTDWFSEVNELYRLQHCRHFWGVCACVCGSCLLHGQRRLLRIHGACGRLDWRAAIKPQHNSHSLSFLTLHSHNYRLLWKLHPHPPPFSISSSVTFGLASSSLYLHPHHPSNLSH